MNEYEGTLSIPSTPTRAVADSVAGGQLIVAPGPFGGATVALEVVARRIRRRFYTSDLDLERELKQAPEVRIIGETTGAPQQP